MTETSTQTPETPQNITLPEVVVTPDDTSSLTAGRPIGSPGVSYGMQERQIMARAVGHPWDAINDFVTQKRGESLSAGYSNADVDAYLQIPHPREMHEQVSARAMMAAASTPDWAPATLAQVPLDPEKPIPEPVTQSLLGPQSRQDYADALSSGQTQSPGQWAQQTVDHLKQDPSQETAKRADRLGEAVAKQLPTQEQALDASMALNLAAGIGFTPEEVAITKQNLLNHWATSGLSPTAIYEKAQQDERLLGHLTQPSRPEQPHPEVEIHFPVTTQGLKDWMQRDLEKPGRDKITHVALPIGPGLVPQMIAGAVGETFGSGDWKKTLERLGFDVAATYIGGVASGYVLRKAGKIVANLWGKRPAFDPAKAPGLTDTAIEHIEAVEPKLGPKKAVTLTPTTEGTTSFGNKFYEHKVLNEDGHEIGYVGFRLKSEDPKTATIDMVHMRGELQNREEFLAGEEEAAWDKLSPTQVRSLARQFFSHNPEIDRIEGLRVSGARKEAGAVGKTSISREQVMPRVDPESGKLTGVTPQEDAMLSMVSGMSQQMYGGFWPKDLWSRLAGTLWSGYGQYKVDRGVGERLARYYMAQGNRAKDAYALTMEPLRKALTQHLDEWEAWLKTPRSPRGASPTIMKMIEVLDGKRGINVLTGDLKDTATGMQTVIGRLQADVSDLLKTRGAGGKGAFERFFRGYYQHLWEEPRAVINAKMGGVPKATAFPSFSEGIRAGLTPRIKDPVEAMLHYSATLSKFTNDTRLLNEMRKAGLAKWGTVAPDGWHELKGTLAHRFSARKNEMLFASPGAAKVWNSYIGEGIHSWPQFGPLKPGDIYDKVQGFSNALLAVRLGWFGFHVSDIAAESQVAGIANALGEFSRAEVGRGLKDLGLSAGLMPGGLLGTEGLNLSAIPGAVRFARRGIELQKAWRDLDNKNPLADLLFGAGLRAEGRSTRYVGGQALDIERMASGASLSQLFKRGTYWRTMKQEMKQGVPGLSGAVNAVERVVDTVNAPMFDKMIPLMKIGVAADEMEAWMRRNPIASHEAAQEAAMRIVDRVDDTLGELNQDNLFWRRTTKQFLNAATVSIGWEYGSLRAFGRGAKDIVNGEWNSPYARWMAAFLSHTYLKNAITQKLKAGMWPWETDTPVRDAFGPQTGGTYTYKGVTTPERMAKPGYEKEVNAQYRVLNEHANVGQMVRNEAGYFLGKLKFPWNQARYALTSTAPNGDNPWNMTDEQGAPITAFHHIELPKGLASYLNYLEQDEIMPITLQNVFQQAAGTNISTLERLMGDRPMGTYFQQPEAAQERLERAERLNDKYQGRRDREQRERLGE